MPTTLKKLLKRPGTALGFIALVVAASGPAHAAIPGADEMIHGCHHATSNPSGALREFGFSDAQIRGTMRAERDPESFSRGSKSYDQGSAPIRIPRQQAPKAAGLRG